MSTKYKEAGVSLESGYESIERIKKHIKSTKSLGFNGDIGGFGGFFDLFKYKYKEPVLVSGTDGVGTKLLLAIEHNTFKTIGIDLVAMCVNDIITSGADPLFFLDYIAVGKNIPAQIEDIVAGISHGCKKGSLSLIGGETAEMPGLYAKGHLDLAGFAVGVVEREAQINGSNMREGDVLIGIPSSGIHSNGYSLVRKVLRDNDIDVQVEFNNSTLLEQLLKPTSIYVNEITALKKEVEIISMSHITGGGYYENLPRMIKDETLGIELDLKNVIVPEIFTFIMNKGDISLDEMYHIFNMGIGFTVLVHPSDVNNTLSILKSFNQNTCVIGHITKQKGIKIL